ncbi:MAG: hypothetical protein KGR69_11805 [Verrucomicrobia bacterium]|nr:hypothetical protein [Verrucomicrobiota bacterium]
MGVGGQTGGGRPAGPVSGRFNEFQRTMLQWTGLHPYNAVHVAKVIEPIDPDRFVDRVRHVLVEAGLTNYSLDERRGRFRYEGGPASIETAVIAGGADPEGTVFREMERQLNERFPHRERFQPFRFFLVTAGEVSYAGLAYFHAVADAESIGRLLLEVVAACRDETPRALRDAGLARRGSSRIPLGGPIAALKRVRGAFRKFQAMRQSHRSPPSRIESYDNAWFARNLDAEASARILAEAKRRGVTLNDLCLAALLIAVIPAASLRFERRRRHLSAGCVVNLRRDLPERRSRDFGLFLGSFAVTHPTPVDITLGELLASVHAQTTTIKRDKLYLASRLEFKANRFLFSRQRPEQQRHFYRKAYPVWGSITNYKMDLEQGATAGVIGDYFRAVSAGPALALVVGITGVGGRLNFGFTYRPDSISKAAVEEIADRLLSLLSGKGVPA